MNEITLLDKTTSEIGMSGLGNSTMKKETKKHEMMYRWGEERGGGEGERGGEGGGGGS